MKYQNFTLYIILLFISHNLYSQTFESSAELRPRFEYRHGFKTLAVDSLNAATFVSQRTRLNFRYGSEKLNAYVAIQNVRVWGDVATMALSDRNGTTVHEAWAEAILSPKLSVKLGRQEINYDDQRIFGSVDWAQQARSHDAMVTTFNPNEKHQLDLGLALSAESESLFELDYDVANYKNFQYLWYHGVFGDVGLSFLFLNGGFAFDNNGNQEVDYNQTIGSRATFAKSKFKADVSLYFQTGKIMQTDLSAYNVAANLHYGFAKNFSASLGAEILSGTDMDATDNTLRSFNPWFGTNHKFNGLMDYFYVGNHINSVGLVDLYATFAFKKDKLMAKLIPHFFSSAANVVDNTGKVMDNALGTEIDFVFGYSYSNNINLQLGYSQMFATETMEVLKGGDKDLTNNWAWVMITFKPKLLNYNFAKE
ncbi:alginate export family protein [Hanstruepera flava]|uniref:alginate export family protein n=1 Tax=Hanstruepera flava TaxID=2930218 RepID=UPI002027F037|nr:alginate export family protein [Hanstruepera flava]